MSYQPPRQTVKKRVRVFTWIILAVNVLILIAVIAYVSSRRANDNGAGFLVLAIAQFWAALDLILVTAWLLTRKRKRARVSPGPLTEEYPDRLAEQADQDPSPAQGRHRHGSTSAQSPTD